VFERFTEGARQVVVLAQTEARELKHDQIGTEHLLLGLLRNEDRLAARVLTSLGVTLDRVRVLVVEDVGVGDETPTGQIPFTPRAKKVLELALREALSLGHNYIGTEHILLGLVRERDGVAARVLREFDADAEKVRNEIIRMLSGPRRRGKPVPQSAARAVRSTRTWEFRVERWSSEQPAVRQEELSKLGADGWELAAVVPSGDGADWVFQRSAVSRPHASPPTWTVALTGESGYRPATVADVENAAAKARREAAEAGDEERAAALAAFEQQFDHAVAGAGELLEGLEVTGSTTLDSLVDAVRAAKDAAIEAADFQTAAVRRDVERKLVAALHAIPDTLRGAESD
jgi:hypothetical protein